METTRRWALTAGIVWGGAVFAATVASLLFGYGVEFLRVIASIYPGFSISWLGSIIGFIYGFADAYIGALIVAWVYAKLAR